MYSLLHFWLKNVNRYNKSQPVVGMLASATGWLKWLTFKEGKNQYCYYDHSPPGYVNVDVQRTHRPTTNIISLVRRISGIIIVHDEQSDWQLALINVVFL